jgi:FkbH-like protein
MNRESVALLFDCSEDRWQALSYLLRKTADRFSMEMADAVAPEFLRLAVEDSRRASDILDAVTAPVSTYLAARLAIEEKRLADAFALVEDTMAQLPRPIPELLIRHAKLARETGDTRRANESLRAALQARPGPAFYLRHGTFIDKLIRAAQETQPRRCKIAVLGDAMMELFSPTLRASCYRDGIGAEIYCSNFGSWRQDILNPASELYAFDPEFVVIAPTHNDVDLPPEGGGEAAAQYMQELSELCRTLEKNSSAKIIQFSLNTPPHASWGGLEEQIPQGRRRLLSKINSEIAETLPPAACFIDSERTSDTGGSIFSAEQWHRARVYPAREAAPSFADAITARIRAAFGLSAKLLIVDLDNTLWGGVIGEDGFDGIVIGPPNPLGEAYLDLQRYLKDLSERGIVLAVCSKNNEDDARLPFQKHDMMILQEDDFSAFRANWSDKASNIANIAETLKLGLESIVFLDDNPMERDWVREQLSDVTVVENDGTPANMLAALDRGRYFENLQITDEDRGRRDSYMVSAGLQKASADNSLESFLNGLDMRCEHGEVDDLRLARVSQLVNKTNQFNLTTTRYTEQQIAQMLTSPDWWWHWFKLSDRYGDHGLIGVISAQRNDTIWTVDLFLMSCRVLGREVENFMAATLWNAAQNAGAQELRANYIPTSKNILVEDLLPRLGFKPHGECKSSGAQSYVCMLADVPAPKHESIIDVSANDIISEIPDERKIAHSSA